MKKFLYILLFVKLLSSCQYVADDKVLTPFKQNQNEVSISEALKIANKIDFSQISNSEKNSKNLVVSFEKKIKETKTIKDEKDDKAIMHIINYDQNSGFVIISGDKRLMPFMAYSNKGNFDTSLKKDGISDWSLYMKKVVKHTKQKNEKQTPIAKHAWKIIDDDPSHPGTGSTIDPYAPPIIQGFGISEYVPQILTSTWDQSAGYNYDCPNAYGGPCDKAYTGCVATAMAQIMRKWKVPSTSQYNFNLMEDAAANNCNPNVNDLQIAHLMRACGNSVNMSYGGNSSSAYTQKIPNALKNMGYSNSVTYTGNLSYSNINGNLVNGWPIIMRGDSGSGSGHAWVADGLATYSTNIMGYYSMSYYHMNWGWSGYCDGWYSFGSINPSHNGTTIGSDYNYNMAAVINIHP